MAGAPLLHIWQLWWQLLRIIIVVFMRLCAVRVLLILELLHSLRVLVILLLLMLHLLLIAMILRSLGSQVVSVFMDRKSWLVHILLTSLEWNTLRIVWSISYVLLFTLGIDNSLRVIVLVLRISCLR